MLYNMYWHMFHHWHFFHNLDFFDYWNMYGNMDLLHVMMMDRVYFVWDVDGHVFAVNKQKLLELSYFMKQLRNNFSTHFIPHKSHQKKYYI